MKRFIYWIIRLIGFIGAIWIPIAVTLVAFGILAEPAEMHEIYRSAVEEAGEHLAPILMGLVCLAILAYVLSVITRHLLGLYRPMQGLAPSVKLLFARSLVCLAIPAFPWLGILVGMRHTAHASVKGIEAKTNETLLDLSDVIAVLLMIALIAMIIRVRRPPRAEIFTRRSVVILSVLMLMVLAVAASVSISQMFGPTAIVALFLSVAVLVLSLGNEAYRRHRIPLVPMLLGLSVIFAYFDLNDDHRLRTFKRPAQKDAGQIQYEALSESLLKSKGSFSSDYTFNTWLANRKDFDAYKKSGRLTRSMSLRHKVVASMPHIMSQHFSPRFRIAAQLFLNTSSRSAVSPEAAWDRRSLQGRFALHSPVNLATHVWPRMPHPHQF
jgi:hypothetical protein